MAGYLPLTTRGLEGGGGGSLDSANFFIFIMFNLNKFFLNKAYNTNNITLSSEILGIYIDSFWKDVFSDLHDFNKKHLLLMVKIQFEGKARDFRTLANMRKVDYSDKEALKAYISENLGLHTDTYTSTPVIKIIFTYIIKKGSVILTDKKRLNRTFNNVITQHTILKNTLPVSMDPSTFGEITGVVKMPGPSGLDSLLKMGRQLIKLIHTKKKE